MLAKKPFHSGAGLVLIASMLASPAWAGIHHAADVVAKDTSHVATKVVKAVKHGAEAAAKGTERGVHAAERGVQRGVKATGNAARTVGRKLDD